LDTRGGAKIGALYGDGVPKVFNVYGKGGVPLNRVSAVVFTVTVVDSEVGDEGGYITVFPCASGRPYSSSLNFVSGQTSANTVIAPVDVNGDVCFYSYGRTHLLADISGYFESGSSFVALAPSRVLDTRGGAKIGALYGDGVPKVFNVYGKGGVPLNRVSAVVFTVTVVDSEVGDEGGYITVFPCASGRPYSSSLNFVSGQTSANTVIAPVDVNGDVCFYSYGRTHLLADISGYISG
jgi:hypothetical protein